MLNFIKGVITGLGGVSPGFSGSILLVIFGLYEKTIDAIANIFKNFKENVLFLFPLFLGIGLGFIIFGRVFDFLLRYVEVYTRFASLGLIIGALPLFYKEVRKKEFKKRYYILMIASLIGGIFLFLINSNAFGSIAEPNILQSVFLGVAVAGSSIIPGVNGAVVLSAFGLYEAFLQAISTFDFGVLIPAGVGLGIGVLVISYIMSKLLRRFYGITFSIVFGLFLAVIPSVLSENAISEFLEFNLVTGICVILFIIGIITSYSFGKLKKEPVQEIQEA